MNLNSSSTIVYFYSTNGFIDYKPSLTTVQENYRYSIIIFSSIRGSRYPYALELIQFTASPHVSACATRSSRRCRSRRKRCRSQLYASLLLCNATRRSLRRAALQFSTSRVWWTKDFQTRCNSSHVHSRLRLAVQHTAIIWNFSKSFKRAFFL